MINFYKYQATGNDFIIIDDRAHQVELSTEQIAQLCNRKFGIGADGLMLLQQVEGYDFKMKYYNADGRESTMCGNGGRSLAQFAHYLGIGGELYSFLAIDGPHQAKMGNHQQVSLQMIDVHHVDEVQADCFVTNTGSPHYVKFVSKVQQVDVFNVGRAIRNEENYKQEGINVNFVELMDDKTLFVRTYERGVEDETLSCGTGVTASAISAAFRLPDGSYQYNIKTLGGTLQVAFLKTNQTFSEVWLTGEAKLVFQGQINL